MKVAVMSATLERRTGYGNITYEYCSALHRKGVEFVLFLPRGEASLAEKLRLPFPVRCILPRYVVRYNFWNIWPYFRRIDVSQFDLVHSLLDFPFCFLAARSAAKYGKPFLMGAQGTYGVMPLTYAPDKYLLQWAYRQAKHIIVPSRFTKEMILQHAGEKYPIEVIHNGVNFSRFDRVMDTKEIRECAKERKILLTVGNFKERRGQDLVLRALGQLKKKRDDFFYVLIGGGSFRSSLEALVQELDLISHVFFVGQQEGDALVRYFQACDIYVHTPRVFRLNFEGFGIVYLEASACGKPIVATDAGGIRDAVLDGKTGIIVPDEDVEGVARALDRLLSDAELRKRLGEEGKRYAASHDWSIIVDDFLKLYADAVRT